jgi:hypothetical protein
MREFGVRPACRRCSFHHDYPPARQLTFGEFT